MNKFHNDLIGGNLGESFTAYYLQKLGKDVQQNGARIGNLDSESNLKRGDLIVSGKWIELKTDFKAHLTGNVCIEPWALRESTAPYYIYLIPHFYWAKKDALQTLVDSWPDRIPAGGFQEPQVLLRINSDTFNENFKPL